MFRSIARFAFGFRRWIVLGFCLITVLSFVFGYGASKELVPGGFEVSDSEAADVASRLEERFGVATPDMVIVYRPTEGAFDGQNQREALQAVTRSLEQHPAVSDVTSELDGASGLISEDGGEALVMVSLRGDDHDKQLALPELLDVARDTSLEAVIGGRLAANNEAQEIARADLVRSEALAVPLVLVLLVVFFRGFVAALLPIALAAFSVGMSLLVLRVAGVFVDISLFALNIVTFLGLGLAVDYALFIVQRFREELAAGREVSEAVEHVVATSGKAVVFSGFAVAASLLGLLWIPIMLLRSVAMIGTVVVLLTNLGAVLFLPALLGWLGPRVGAARPSRRAAHTGRWARIARFCMRRRFPIAIATTLVLLAMASPFLRMKTAISDARVFPTDSDVRQVHDALESEFAVNPVDAHVLMVRTRDGSDMLAADNLEALFAYSEQIEGMEHVDEVIGVTTSAKQLPRAQAISALSNPDTLPAFARERLTSVVDGDATVLRVMSGYDGASDSALAQLEGMLEAAPARFVVEASGRTANLAEVRHALGDRLLPAALTVAAVTILVLLLAFGAVPVALKAVVLDALSLTASFGALVWVFQDGRFESVLDYSSVGAIDPTIVVMMFALVFGLSMDYEMFLISRIREFHDKGADDVDAVAHGLEVTGPVITRAAALLLAVVLGFLASDLIFLKELGLGMGIAILVDATIVRLLLVPSTMAMLGKWNWWAPVRFHRWWKSKEIGVDEGGADLGPSSPERLVEGGAHG